MDGATTPRAKELANDNSLRTLYGVSAFGDKFALYRYAIDYDEQKGGKIYPRPREASNNAIVTPDGKVPLEWWSSNATTRGGKKALELVAALSKAAFHKLESGMPV